MTKTSPTSEDLKGRMLRHISAIWGVKNTEALDPLVRVLIEALAGELQKTYFEINNFEKRILEKIAELMTPGILSAPYCAHAIAHAQPVENMQVLLPEHHIFLKKKPTSDKDQGLEVYFTPVDGVRLFDASLRYIVAGNKCFSMDANVQKSLLLDGIASKGSNNTIWLGIRYDQEVNTLHNLRFYIDFKNTVNKQQLLSLLHVSEWQVNGRKVETVKGIVYENSKVSSPEAAIFSDYDPMLLIEKEIKHFYNDQFITLRDEKHEFPVKDILKNYPAEFESIYSPTELAMFKGPALWIKIITPSPIEERTLFDLFIAINAFPILNRFLLKNAHRFKGISNIIPIKTDVSQYFLAVKSLTDSLNREFRQIPYSDHDMIGTGTYSVRRSGTERIDTRTAKEYLSYLIELIRDESVAFSSYGQDTVGSLVKDIDRTLAQIDQRVRQNKNYHTDSYHYISLEFNERQDGMSLEYWITNSIHGNSIHVGTKLKPYQGSELKTESIVLLTTTTGGKKSLDPSRHMEAYKYAMLTHNRIITLEDIKAFCMLELGDKIEQVEIRKGVVKSENPKEGLVRCVEILLKRNQYAHQNFSTSEWEYLLKDFRSKLELRSAVNLNYLLTVQS